MVRTKTRGVEDWQLADKVAEGALFGHVGGGAVMIEAVGPIREALRAEMKFGGVEIAGRRIHAQRVDTAS